MTLFFFDFDKTLYTYNFRVRLPVLSRMTGVSQYHLAKTWWAGGFERRAEAGEWRTPDEYFDQFERITGARLDLEGYCEARDLASSPIPESIDALRFAAEHGTAALLSNNPSPFAAALPDLAPDVYGVVGANLALSCYLGARKPDPEAYLLALTRFEASADDVFFVDDSAENVAGAIAVGITAHQLRWADGVPMVGEISAALMAFVAARS
ncbi:MAG: HAD-IA family hydrolase [Actinomycetota bacterium]